jgi:uncharacterized membrane protein
MNSSGRIMALAEKDVILKHADMEKTSPQQSKRGEEEK